MRHRKNSVVLSGMLTTVLLLQGGPADAQSGGLDPSFGTDGTVVTAVTSSRDRLPGGDHDAVLFELTVDGDGR